MPIYNTALKNIDLQETRRYAGLGSVVFNEAELMRACTEAQILSHPRGIWEIYNYSAYTGQIEHTSPIHIEGNAVKRHLQQAEKIILFSATLGEEIENAITAYFEEGAYSYSLILDAAATTAIEATADEMEKAMLQTVEKQGYKMLRRFSPGYGDWDIHFQPQMLLLTDAQKIGIRLTESYMLTPRKSITAVIGLIPSQTAFIKQKENCANCAQNNCLARKENNP